MGTARALRDAWRIKKALDKMSICKETTLREAAGLPPIVPWTEKCCEGVGASIRECLCRSFCPCCIGLPSFGELVCPKMSFGYRLCTDGHYPNKLIKSILGFLFGLGLTMGIFFFLCLQFEANYEFALVVCICLGAVLSLGMAFSPGVRCLVFLALPTTCSKKGRTFLLMYAMVLVFNHPVQNYSHNVNVLTEAATCGQNLALNQTKSMATAAASPILTIIGGVKKMLISIRQFANTIRNAFKALIRSVKEIVSIIGSVIKWIASMVDVCNVNMGKPYQKCKKVFEDGYNDCKDKLGIFDFLCDVVSLIGQVCHIARFGELLCIIVGAIKDLVLDQVGPPVSRRIAEVKEMFYFNVSISYHFHYNMNQSKSYSEIRAAILAEIKAKMSIVTFFQGVLDNVMPLMVLMVVFKAFMYRRSYLTKDGFDNVYITALTYVIDERRKKMGKDTILPLKWREKFKYIPTFTIRMTKQEAKRSGRGLLFWGFTAFNAGYYLVCDYGMYWILDLVSNVMEIKTEAALPPYLKMHVRGKGPMADMYKAMVGILEPVTDDGLGVDTSVCLPRPKEPNWQAYKTIIGILVICFFLTLFEAHGLRLRHAIAACYYPHREKSRAVWLYNHIVLMRHSFIEHTQRQLQRRKKGGGEIAKVSLRSRLAAKYPIIKKLLKLMGYNRKNCLSCGEEGAAKDMDKFTHCDNCNSPYCNQCFADLGNVCTYCMAPADYGDIDDQDVETDSSENEEEKRIRLERLKAKKKKAVKKTEERNPAQLVKAFQSKYGNPQKSSSETALLAFGEMMGPAEMEEGGGGDQGSESNSSDDGEDGESTQSESTSAYDTDYQHRPATTSSSESSTGAARRARYSKPRPERESMDIFKSRNDDSDSESD